MSEINQVKKTKKKNKAEIVLEKKVHPIILFYDIIFSFFMMYYSLYLNRLPFLISLILLSITSFLTYYNYYGRKIVITKNKFYVYRLGKKTISLSYSKDFLHIKYEKTKLGRLLDYGSILLVTQENKYYKIHFIKEPEEVFYSSINEYENVMSLLNPKYERQLNKNSSNDEIKIKKDDFEKIED